MKDPIDSLEEKYKLPGAPNHHPATQEVPPSKLVQRQAAQELPRQRAEMISPSPQEQDVSRWQGKKV